MNNNKNKYPSVASQCTDLNLADSDDDNEATTIIDMYEANEESNLKDS